MPRRGQSRGTGLERSRGTSLLLRALLAQRGACLQPRATTTAETEHTHTVSRYFAVDGREIRHNERELGLARGRGSMIEVQRAQTRKQTTEELHGTLGSSRAKSLNSPAPRGRRADGEMDGPKRTSHPGMPRAGS